jgi:hypothetical protein
MTSAPPLRGDEWLTPAELAAHEGISLIELTKMLDLEPLLSRLRRQGRYPLSQIDQFLDGCL